MQQFFLESPVALGLCGFFVALATAFWWMQTGARMAAIGAAVVSVVTALLVLVNLNIETDREQIRRTIDLVAEALKANDFPRVISYIHPGAAEGVARAKGELSNYHFLDARLTRLRSIEVNRRASPPAAIAEFNVAVEVEREGHRVPIRRFVKVYFAQQAERWLVRDYEHFDPLAGIEEE